MKQGYSNKLTFENKLYRQVWSMAYFFLFRPFSHPFFWRWRNFVLKIFGAKIGKNAGVHASAKIWAPCNLEMDDYACIDDNVEVYNVNKIYLGRHATVSKKSFLCTASHNYNSRKHELITAPIRIEAYAWVAVGVFVNMGVTIGEGAVVGAWGGIF